MYWALVMLLILVFGVVTAKMLFKTIKCPLGIFTLVWNGLFFLYSLQLVEYIDITVEARTVIILSYVFFLFGSVFTYIIDSKDNRNALKECNKTIISFEAANKGVNIAIMLSNLGMISWLIQTREFLGLGSFTTLNMYVTRALVQESIGSLTNYVINVFSIGGNIIAGILVGRGFKYKKKYMLLFVPTIVVASFTGQRFMTIINLLSFLSPSLVLGANKITSKLSGKKLKSILLVLLALIVFFVAIGNKRGSFDEVNTIGKLRNPILVKTYLYITGSFAAFSEQLQYWDGSLMYGANTFLPFVKFTNRMGITNYDSSELAGIDTGRPFVYIPSPFNVYSYLGDVVCDWGYVGVLVFPILLGMFSTHFWFKCNKSRSISYEEILLSLFMLFIMYSFIASVTSFSTVWYAYTYAIVVLEVFSKKSH